MNFQPDGGYSIGLLNDPHGPRLFAAMCVATVALTHGYFVYNGFIEPLVTWEGLRRGLFRRVPGFGPWKRRGARAASAVPRPVSGIAVSMGSRSSRAARGSVGGNGSGSGDSPRSVYEREPLMTLK